MALPTMSATVDCGGVLSPGAKFSSIFSTPAEGPLRVNRVTLTTRRSFPVFPDKQTCSEVFGSVTPPVLVDSVLKPSGIRGSSPSAGWLQVGQGMPAAHTDHFQLPAPSNGDDSRT